MTNRILRRLKRDWYKAKSSYAKYFLHKPIVLSSSETIDLIINKRYSISRNGDGEIDIMIGESIPFQKYDDKLASILKEAISTSLGHYISAIPDIFTDLSSFNQSATSYFANYLKFKRWAYYSLAKLPKYGDTLMSRFYIDYVDKSDSHSKVGHLKHIWENQHVILVEGKESRLGVNNDLFDKTKSLQRILGPSENAFDKHDELFATVKHHATSESLILLALGPTATAMAFELAKEGYWAVDIGHVDIEYEWLLLGAETKVPIPGKYTNESTMGKLIGTLPESALSKYESQIVARIF